MINHKEREDECRRIFDLLLTPISRIEENVHIEPRIEANYLDCENFQSMYELLIKAECCPDHFKTASAIASRLIEAEKPLPLLLKGFVRSILEGATTAPKKRGNPSKLKIRLRNIAVYAAMQRLVNMGMQATAGDDKEETITAAVIVSHIAEEYGVNLKDKTIEKEIWSKREEHKNINFIFHALAHSELLNASSSNTLPLGLRQ